MMKKKSQFFAIYLVLITLFMCFIVISLYYLQNKKLSAALVSPTPFLELQDQQVVFEIQERNFIILSARDVFPLNLKNIPSWGSDEFREKFEEYFLYYITQPGQKQFTDFLYLDSIYGQSLDISKIYSFIFENDMLKIERKPLEKFLLLRAVGNNEQIKFPIRVEYTLPEKTYLIGQPEVIDGFKFFMEEYARHKYSSAVDKSKKGDYDGASKELMGVIDYLFDVFYFIKTGRETNSDERDKILNEPENLDKKFLFSMKVSYFIDSLNRQLNKDDYDSLDTFARDMASKLEFSLS